MKTSQDLVFQILEVTLPKQKLKIFRRCQIDSIKISIQNYIWKCHENDSMQKITFNGPNFLWKFLGVFGIHRLITIIILFTNFTKPYSSEPKLRRRRFGTFWRFLTFNLAKLSLKSEMSRIEMDFWKKVFTFCSPGLKLLKLWINDWYPNVAIAYFYEEKRHKQEEHNFCLVFTNLHVLKCDLYWQK